MVTAVCVVVRTLEVSVVVPVEVAIVDEPPVDAALVELLAEVESVATVAGWSGAFVAYRCVVALLNEPAKIENVVKSVPSLSAHAGTFPAGLRRAVPG